MSFGFCPCSTQCKSSYAVAQFRRKASNLLSETFPLCLNNACFVPLSGSLSCSNPKWFTLLLGPDLLHFPLTLPDTLLFTQISLFRQQQFHPDMEQPVRCSACWNPQNASIPDSGAGSSRVTIQTGGGPDDQPPSFRPTPWHLQFLLGQNYACRATIQTPLLAWQLHRWQCHYHHQTQFKSDLGAVWHSVPPGWHHNWERHRLTAWSGRH